MRRRQGLRAQMRTYNAISRELQRAARQAAHGRKSHYCTMGRRWETLTFETDQNANDFMARNPGWGVIGVIGRTVHVAQKADDGTPE